MGQSRPLFVYFRDFLNTISIIQIEKSVDGVLGIQTWGRRMVGADETTELWRPPWASFCLFLFFSHDKYSTDLTISDKNVDGVLGIRTQGRRMVVADKTTVLWWPPKSRNR